MTGHEAKEAEKIKEIAAAIDENVQAHFHKKAIFQQAVPALLRNSRIKKLLVHRVVGFTHASWGELPEDPRKAVDRTQIYFETLADIFNTVHILDPVEFDLEQYERHRKSKFVKPSQTTVHVRSSATRNGIVWITTWISIHRGFSCPRLHSAWTQI